VEGEDRLCQSVVCDFDHEGTLLRVEFHDGVMRSAARLSYQVAQRIVDGDGEARAAQPAGVVDLVVRMDELARILRRRRYARGSLDFDLPEPHLILSATGEVTGIVPTERLDSMRAIEEFMLAANEAVAAALTAGGAPALYRIHEVPDPLKVEEFSELVTSFGYRLPAAADQVRPHDFQLVLRQVEGKPEEKFVSFLLLRTMRLARYHEENLGHFGLATASYSHFTSPIRRYPDLVVHRALRAMRHRLPPTAGLAEALPEMGRHLSDRERKATDAERELLEWKKVRFMAAKVGETFSGYVTGVQAFGLFVELLDVYVQGLVHVSSMTDDYYAFDERGHRLTGANTQAVYRLGDLVQVQVARVDLERRQIDLGLVEIIRRAAEGRIGPRRPPARPASRPPRAPRAPAPPPSRPRRRSRRLG
jgi:ribonuclease R